jgi:hypothetical protein
MKPCVEPPQALLCRSVSERLGNNISLSLHLQTVVADHAGCSQGFLHITSLKELMQLGLLSLFRVTCPYAGQTVCL